MATELIRHRPAPPLDRFIECFWWSHRDQVLDCREHMLPSGSAQLIFALHETPLVCWQCESDPIEWHGSVVHGPQSSYYVAGPKPCGAAAGVSFRPGAAGAVLGIPPNELTDRHVPLDALWGARAAALRERLLAARDPTAIFRILHESLMVRIERPLLMHPAIAQALAAPSPVSSWTPRIAEIERAAGYSPRHFIALFRAAVGLGPKHYYRMQRFNAAARHLAAGTGEGLADIAAAFGYSDQAHLTREFRDFAGVAPSQYRPSSPGSPLHHRTR